jgi:SNF2 family DNA or RNA helicase
METMAEVVWGTFKQYEPISSLEIFTGAEDRSFRAWVRDGRYGRLESVRSVMTFEKLRGDLNSIVYSMQTAEIDFYAHQFLPVLKFVNSPLDRLLIADEVGLGKTIEASLIWTECQARFKSRRLLVICPPSLIPKWLRELQEKFGIEARPADAKMVLGELHALKRKGAGHAFALVTSYHALRPRKKERKVLQPWLSGNGEQAHLEDAEARREATRNPRISLLKELLEWNAAHHFVDLVVFDEAHLMKNTATSSHTVGDVFARFSRSTLALTATPVTTKSRDLFSLLRLVDPDMFRDEKTFKQLLNRNRPAVRLANELARTQPDRKKCLKRLEEIPHSTARDNLAKELSALPARGLEDVSTKVELWHRSQRLNELGCYLNRTRKVEAIPNKVVRTPVTLTVRLSTEEKVLYNGLLRLIRAKIREEGGALTVFHLIAPALAMSSCLPVVAESLRKGNSRWGDLKDLETLGDSYGADEPDNDREGEFVAEDAMLDTSDLRWLPKHDFTSGDSKYRALKQGLKKHVGKEKVIIFAFFKATLKYLEQRLTGDGFSCVVVTGDITDRDKRDQMLQSFEDPRHQILLCSEVAAEGVDLQFCRIMVNYDLPWNPMRVEQRIGRIDRIGQQANSITIINFNVRDTIDGQIYEHLHRKIGLFTSTIGDLEGILGEEMNKLTRNLLADDLTPKEMEERIRRTELALENQRRNAAEIDSEAESLVGLSNILQDTVNRGQSLGRYIKATELRRYTEEFFQENYQGRDLCDLNWDSPAEDCLSLRLRSNALHDFKQFLEKTALPFPKGFNPETGKAVLTFSPSRHEALRRVHRGLVLVNHLHPFVRWMTDARRTHVERWHPVCRAVLETNEPSPGDYLFLCQRLSLENQVMPRNELLFRAVRLKGLHALDPVESERLVDQVLEQGRSSAETSTPPSAPEAFEAVVQKLTEDRIRVERRFAEELELRINSRRAQIERHFANRIQIAQRRLQTMEESRPRRTEGIRLTESQIKSLEETRAREMKKLGAGKEIEQSFSDLICGLVRVTEKRPL